jgi:hypothetical protein
MRSTFATALAAAVLLSISLLRPAPVQGQTRMEPATEEPQPVQPVSPFDPKAAFEALGNGTSSIQGKACSYYDDRQFRADFRPVYLLPVTSYLEEWLQLRKARKKRPVAPLSEVAFSARIEAMTDEEGRFHISHLKPGRYLILVPFSFEQAKTATEYMGSTTAWNGPQATQTNYYQQYAYELSRSNLLEEIVEIARDNQKVRVSVRNPGFWKKGGLLGKLLPCTW